MDWAAPDPDPDPDPDPTNEPPTPDSQDSFFQDILSSGDDEVTGPSGISLNNRRAVRLVDPIDPDFSPNPTNEAPITSESLDSLLQDICSSLLPREPQVDHIVDLSQLTRASEPQVDHMVDLSQLTSTLEPQADRSSLPSDKGSMRSMSAGDSPNRSGSQCNQRSCERSPTAFGYYDKASDLGSGSKSMDHKQRTHGDARRSTQFDSDDQGTDGRSTSANATQGAMNRPQVDQSTNLPSNMSSANATQGASQFLSPIDPQLAQSSLTREMLDPSQVDRSDLPCYMGSESSPNAVGGSIQFAGQCNQRIGERPQSAFGGNPSEWKPVQMILNAASRLMSLNRPKVDQSTILPSNMSSANATQGASQFLSPTDLQLAQSSLPREMLDPSQVDRSDLPCYMGSESSPNAVGSLIQFAAQCNQRIGKRPLSALGDHNQAGGMGSESQSRDQRRRSHGAAGSSIQFDSDCTRRTVSATLGEITQSFPSHDQDASVGRIVQPTVIQLDGSFPGSRRRAHGALGDIQLGYMEGTKPGLGTSTIGGSQTPNVPTYNPAPSMPGPSERSQATFRNDWRSVAPPSSRVLAAVPPFGEPLQNPNFGQHAAPAAQGVQAGSRYKGYMGIPGLLPPRTPEDLRVKGLLSNPPPQQPGVLRCDLCGGDLAVLEPTVSRYAADPAVEVRRCGHCYHVNCLRSCFEPEFPFPPCYLPCTLCTKK